MFRRIAALAAIALVATACGDDTPAGSLPAPDSLRVTIGGDVGGSLPSEFQELVDTAERLRGLQFLTTPTITVLSPDELADRVAADIAEDLDPAELDVDESLFVLLGLLEADTDLGAALTALYAEQVGGFYDPDTGELVVADGGDLSPLAKTILIHELVHALTDQHFEFATRFDALFEDERFHEAAALQALIEGDATYFQLIYLQEELSGDDRVEAVVESLEVDTTVLDSLPAWMGLDLAFPYNSGFTYVQRLVDEAGIEGLNAAYERYPETTEHILHPQSYLRLEPAVEVTLPATPLPGYELYEDDVFGEWNVQLLLLDGVSGGQDVIGASGWGGDRYRVLDGGGETAFVYRYVGDTPRDAEELLLALLEVLPARMAVGAVTGADDGPYRMIGADYAYLERSGAELVLVAATDPAAGEALAGMLALAPAA